MPTRGLNGGAALERLGADECWRLLESRSFGRICFCVDERVAVELTTYAARQSTLYFRVGAFGQVARSARDRAITLQVDDTQEDREATWTVALTGTSSRVADAATLASLWSPPRAHPWEAGVTPQWLMLAGADVQGRRVRS